MKTVTFDTTTRPKDGLVENAISKDWYVAYVSVTFREASGTDFELDFHFHEKLPELGVWDEPEWDDARWGDESSSDFLENILEIIGNGSFPKKRENLNHGQLHQLRDALILEAHTNEQRDVFVSDDLKAFISYGKKKKLEKLCNTMILTTSEFDEYLNRQG